MATESANRSGNNMVCSAESESIIGPGFSEENWVIEIKEILKDDNEDDEVRVSVFEVPEPLRSVNPRAYGPQLLAFGPYHHFRPKPYEMERFKVAAALKAQHDWLFPVDFEQLVADFKEREVQIRFCYQKHLDIHEDTLAWMMAIDGLSLLKVLNCSLDHYKHLPDSAQQNPFYEFSEKFPDLDMILRDMFMLENQIPMIVLRAIADKWPESGNPQMLADFVEILSPLQLAYKPSASEVVNHMHLLDLLYRSVCPKQDRKVFSFAIEKVDDDDDDDDDDQLQNSTTEVTGPIPDCSILTQLLAMVSKLQFSSFTALPARLLNLFLTSLELFGISPDNFLDEGRGWIPTVSQLNDAGLKFSTSQAIKDIKFDKQTLYLPVITLNSEPDKLNMCSSKLTSEVILRNLVAFESMSKEKSDSLPFTRYTQLMNGIIGNADDVNFLKKANIIKGDLDNIEIANLFNGLSDSFQPKDRDINIDEAIREVNNYYDNTLKVKVNKLLKKYIYSSWKLLTVLASFLLLALLVLETFCDFYTCRVIRFRPA